MQVDNESVKYKQMTEEPVERLVCKLAVPTILSMLITSFYNMADTFFVGKLNNPSAVGAVGVVFSLMAIIQACGFFFGHGSGNYISRELGKREVTRAKEMASVGFVSAVVFGIILAVVGHLFLTPFATALGSTDTILPYAKSYMGIILIGAPWMCGSLVLNNQLRYQGLAFYSMLGLVSGGVINLVLDPIFIFMFDMGISGAALATTISQFISFMILLVGNQLKSSVCVSLSDFKPSGYYIREMIAGGLPSLARQGIAAIAAICLNTSAAPFGDTAVAAMNVVTRVTMFLNSALIGFGQGFQPVCGFNYGAGLKKRVTAAFYFCVKLGTAVLIVVSTLVLLFTPQIIGQFSADSAEVVNIGVTALRFQAVVFCLNPFIVLSNMLLQTIRKPVRATTLALARQGLAFIPLVLILPHFLGIRGIELAQPIADAFTFVLTVIIQKGILFGELRN